MKILHVLYSGLGGHGIVFFSMLAADEAHEFEYQALFNGIEDVQPGYIERCKNLKVDWNFVKKKRGIDISYYKKLASIFRNSTAEVIFLHSSSYILPAIMANFFGREKKRIFIRETQANALKTAQDWIWLCFSFLTSNKIIFLSEEYKKEIAKKLSWIYAEKKITVIPNGIDINKYKPGIKPDEKPVTIGMQSRLAENKDHSTLLRAVSILKNEGFDIKLKIAGDGTTKNKLIQLSKQLYIDDCVEFTGMLQEDDLISFLQRLNIYVHASFGETMSTAIMQAMATGLPIAASDVNGINNMITDGKTGILVPVSDQFALAEAIKELIASPALSKTLSGNALLYAKEKFSNKTMFNLYKKLFTA